jgi:hypothetical protein
MRKAPALSAPEPSREAILDFIDAEREAGREVGRREIAKAFGLSGGGKIWLKRLLKELEEEGETGGDGVDRPVHPRGALPPVLLCEIKGKDRDGDAYGVPLEWNEAEQGVAPRILIERPREFRAKRHAAPAPAFGDQVLLKLTRLKGVEGYAYSGRVLKVMGKGKAQVLGIFRAMPDGSGRLIPIDKKAQGREALIPKGQTGDAEDGDLVSVALRRETRFGPPEAQVKERLGSLKSERAVSLIAIHAHGIPNVFQPATIAESEAVRPAGTAGREDWRDLPLITIDPADAKDHDDAVHAAPDDDPDNPGGHVVTVAIADVAPMCGRARRSTARRWSAATRSISPTASCRCCRSGSPTTSARCARRGPAGARRAARASTPRFQEEPFLPPHPDALGCQALLPAGPGRHRRTGRREGTRSGPRHDPDAALGRLWRRSGPRARCARAAGSRPARAQADPEARRFGRPGRRARTPRRRTS